VGRVGEEGGDAGVAGEDGVQDEGDGERVKDRLEGWRVGG
jgi:hypothetical protein